MHNPTVRELKQGVYLREGLYSFINPQLGTNRNGGQYLKCLLRDSTGHVSGREVEARSIRHRRVFQAPDSSG